ncbi:pLS20_p028 family conjugation system transmembrane protein [Bacillus pseudomycoides]|uniref:pLS20_p028 family conjugation system transmembrane protein n=1 Tax=Bacillus pseudomycoides TaxID=64104 RepID=UPI00215AED24|nr:7TM-DISM domain-containing protein [Bacillus pseudomycoides]MCR8860663.1 7TM-DISM domain-containing protein [Bacillus pseudomycoides]
MNDEKVLEILKTFSEYLEIGGFTNYILRSIGWMIIIGLSYLVDALEGITDKILFVKTLFASEQVQSFVRDFQPVLYILFALSLIYIGYTLIFNRKTNREQIAVNIFISMGVIVLLSTAMMQADKFTDKAIKAVDLKGSGTTSEKIIKDGLTDVAQFDIEKWKTTKLKEPNKIPQENIRRIDILEKIDKGFKIDKDTELSKEGKAVLEKKMSIAPNGKEVLIDLKNGWFDFWPDKYYRWDWDFWKIAPSLFVIGMTLLFTAIKLGKLCFELAFSYILANLVAPADVANGQKTKHILLNILNSFLIMIMIFISLKLYLIGMNYIHENVDGIAYVLALICLSLAVVDGPVICERIFGIDAGLKNGWGVVAGGYALGKGISKATGNIASKAGNMLKSTGKGALQAGAGAAGIANGYKNAGKTNGGEQKEQKQGKEQQGKENGKEGKEQQGKENGKEGKEKQGDANGGANGTGHSSIQDEMKSSGFDKEAKSEGQGSSANVSGGTQSGGSGTPTSASGGSKPGGSGAPSSTTGGSQSSGGGAPSSTTGGSQSSGGGAPSSTTGGSQSSGSGTPSSTSGGSQSSGGGAPSSAPEPPQPNHSGTSSSDESSSGSSRPVDTAPTSTEDIPAPQRENRTIGQYAKDRLSNAFHNSPTVQKTKRSYQLGQNTGEGLRNKRQNKNEGQNTNQNPPKNRRKDA